MRDEDFPPSTKAERQEAEDLALLLEGRSAQIDLPSDVLETATFFAAHRSHLNGTSLDADETRLAEIQAKVWKQRGSPNRRFSWPQLTFGLGGVLAAAASAAFLFYAPLRSTDTAPVAASTATVDKEAETTGQAALLAAQQTALAEPKSDLKSVRDLSRSHRYKMLRRLSLIHQRHASKPEPAGATETASR